MTVPTSIMVETSMVMVALVAATVMVDMVAVGFGNDKAILDMVEGTAILAIIAMSLQILDPRKEETLDAEVWLLWLWMLIFHQTTKPRWLCVSLELSSKGLIFNLGLKSAHSKI